MDFSYSWVGNGTYHVNCRYGAVDLQEIMWRQKEGWSLLICLRNLKKLHNYVETVSVGQKMIGNLSQCYRKDCHFLRAK